MVRGVAPPPSLGRTRAPTFTAGFAVGWVLSLGALGTFTVVWLMGMVATVMFFVLGTGGLGSVLLLGFAGVLLGRGWWGMLHTIYERLRWRDLAEPPPLPEAFWALSPGLQRLVRHARSVRVLLEGHAPSPPDLDREMFDWLGSMAQLPAPDQHALAQRGLDAAVMHEMLVHGRWAEDREGPGARGDQLVRARAMLDRFERDVLGSGGDPFRGITRRGA